MTVLMVQLIGLVNTKVFKQDSEKLLQNIYMVFARPKR